MKRNFIVKWDGGGSEVGEDPSSHLSTQGRGHFGASKALREGQWCQMRLGAGQWTDCVCNLRGHVSDLFFTLRAARSSGGVFRRAPDMIRFEFCKAYLLSHTWGIFSGGGGRRELRRPCSSGCQYGE